MFLTCAQEWFAPCITSFLNAFIVFVVVVSRILAFPHHLLPEISLAFVVILPPCLSRSEILNELSKCVLYWFQMRSPLSNNPTAAELLEATKKLYVKTDALIQRKLGNSEN